MASIELTSSGKSIIFVHGRGWKPAPQALTDLWVGALRAGLARDFSESDVAAKLDATKLVTAYYGDLTNASRSAAGKTYDDALDLADLNNALKSMTVLTNAKKFRRAGYEALPSRSSIREFLADMGAPVLSLLGLTELALARRMPEVSAYWDQHGAYYRDSKERVIAPLRAALERGDEVMLISHCLGSVITYDCLWELCHDSNPIPGKIDTWITLGSPLADEFFKRKLAGASQSGDNRYPHNLVNWYNVAAEDDFTCHDETVANDFAEMLKNHLISRIKDYQIYNLAVRYGRSNPHTSVGYLIHPRVAKLVAEWL
ncbi:MAG: hypothetical protein O7B25_07285 [Gammaproteobacteria bacterium]|nr:hypothetical protein [Gammaproteobacteria bacterium]